MEFRRVLFRSHRLLRSNQIGPPAMAGLSFFWMSMLIEIEGNEVGRRAKSTEPQHSATGSAASSWLRLVGGSSLPYRRRAPSPDADLPMLSRQGAGGSLWQFISPNSRWGCSRSGQETT